MNILALASIATLSVLVTTKRLCLNQDLSKLVPGGLDLEKMARLAYIAGQSVSLAKEDKSSHTPGQDIIGYCSKCGNRILTGSTFCEKCGTPVPEYILPETNTTGETPEKAEPDGVTETREENSVSGK